MNEDVNRKPSEQPAPGAEKGPAEKKPLPERQEAAPDFQALISGQYREAYVRHVARLLAAQQAETERYAAFRRMKEQAEALQEQYPDFTLDKALDEPQLVRLLQAGVELKTAWEVLHRQELERAAAQRRSSEARPRENGLGAASAAVLETDPRQLSPEERRQLRRRAAMGEKIVW